MAEGTNDNQLREMAEHRGFKLVRSRRRKPGVGDFGKFGLTDAAGKPVLGVGDDGLTASARDVEAYLRQDALSTWKQSAESPLLPAKRTSGARPIVAEHEAPVLKRRTSLGVGQAHGESDGRPKGHHASKTAFAEREVRSRTLQRPVETHPPPPKLELVLVVRPVKRGDDEALAELIVTLLGQDANRAEMAANLIAAQKGQNGMIVATLGDLVGCCAWTVVQTPHLGIIGRITLILVHEDYRRRGIGRQLLEAAGEVLSRKGCSILEAMSGIDLRNSHGFFRSLPFEQSSYRFVRAIK